MNNNHLESLVEEVGRLLISKQLMVTTAESCSAGGVALALTSLAESGQWFDRGFITYSVESKTEILGVSQETLDQYGVVSEETALEMARGALNKSRAHIGVAITGLAGPDKGPERKPVGTVCFAWCSDSESRTETRWFDGDRNAICRQSIESAIKGLQGFIRERNKSQ